MTSIVACLIALKRPEVLGLLILHRTPYVGSADGAEVYEYGGVSTDEVLELKWETPGEKGFDHRAVVARGRR
jgi:hypothetical protein